MSFDDIRPIIKLGTFGNSVFVEDSAASDAAGTSAFSASKRAEIMSGLEVAYNSGSLRARQQLVLAAVPEMWSERRASPLRSRRMGIDDVG
jgi:hypothetical protein